MNKEREVVCFCCGKQGHILKFCRTQIQSETGRSDQGQNPQNPQTQSKGQSAQKDSKVTSSSVSPANKRKCLMIEVNINGNPRLCVVDTGASVSLISNKEWQFLCNDSGVLLRSDIVAEAANNSPIGILGKTVLSVDVEGKQQCNQEFYVANDMMNAIIFGLDWLLSCSCVIDIEKLLISFPDGTQQALLINDSAMSDPTNVTLCEDIEIPAKHEIIQTACIKGPFIDESILEPNSNLVEKGILIAMVLVRPKQQIIPIQIINPGVDKVKLYKETNIGSLEHVDIRDPVLQEMSDENANELPFRFDHLEQKERK